MENPAVTPTSLEKAVPASNTPKALNQVGTPDATGTLFVTGEKTSATAMVHKVKPGAIVIVQQEQHKTEIKSVSPQKLAANRRNAKRSTGPRTERGKKASKFNAVTTGLFAKHVVIPQCDGYESEEEFAKLLAGLQQEFQPQGPSEQFWVAQIAQCMWRLPRATWSEKGSVRNVALWEQRAPDGLRLAQDSMDKLNVLKAARQEIKATKALSPESYTAVLPLLELEQRDWAQAGGNHNPCEPKIDREFLASLKYQIQITTTEADFLTSIGNEMNEDYYAGNALPRDAAMNKILRYEKAVQKKFDWALQNLLESQQRRKNSQATS